MGKVEKITGAEIQHIRVLAKQSYTVPEIAAKIGRCKQTVYSIVKNNCIATVKRRLLDISRGEFISASDRNDGNAQRIASDLNISLSSVYQYRRKYGITEKHKKKRGWVKPSEVTEKTVVSPKAPVKKVCAREVKRELCETSYTGAACTGCICRTDSGKCNYSNHYRGTGIKPEEPKCEHDWDKGTRKIYRVMA